jgi:hypothetical protein
MRTPDCLARWTRTCEWSWKHPSREYRVSYAVCGNRILWDAWLGTTTKTAMPEQVEGGLPEAIDAVIACRQHAAAA